MFWLDVEHFKHFDGRNENLRLFAHHISTSVCHTHTHPLTHSFTHSLTHSPTHTPTHSLTHSPTHPLSLHPVLKYIGDFAELPLSLPQHIQQSIVTSMQQDTITKGDYIKLFFNEHGQLLAERPKSNTSTRYAHRTADNVARSMYRCHMVHKTAFVPVFQRDF